MCIVYRLLPSSTYTTLLLLSGFSDQGSPQRIFHLQLFLSSVCSCVTSTSAMSSFIITSINVLFKAFPVSSFLATTSSASFSHIYPSSFLRTCPYHLNPASRVFYTNITKNNILRNKCSCMEINICKNQYVMPHAKTRRFSQVSVPW